MADAYELILRGGRAVLPGVGLTECDLALRDGRFAAILAPGARAAAAEEMSVAGLVALPGVIDPHLHLGHGKDIARPRIPEDADRETAAAAAGGVTCFIPYLLATQPYEEVFDEVRQVTEAGARIDFGYHFIISTEAQLAGVRDYVSRYGVPSFKIFMNNRGGEGARLGLPDIDDGFLLRLCEAAAMHGGMVCPHPETIELAWVLRERLLAEDPQGKGGLATWNASRPAFVEAEAIQRAAFVAGHADAPLYLVHTSSRQALEMALLHRARGTRLFIETCPQYLTHDIGWQGGDVGKINPPLREAGDRDRLWQGLIDGEIDTLGTDHVHRGIDSKQGGIWAASPGCPGLETLLPVLISQGFHARGLPLARIAQVTARNPARLMGLSHRKGAIAPSLDADLAFVDLDADWTFERSDVRSSAGYSIYEGERFRGRVVHSLVRGRFTLQDGELAAGSAGTGRFCERRLTRRFPERSSLGAD